MRYQVVPAVRVRLFERRLCLRNPREEASEGGEAPRRGERWFVKGLIESEK